MPHTRNAPSAGVLLRTVVLGLAIVLPLAGFAWVLHVWDIAGEQRVLERQSSAIVDLEAQTIARETKLVEADLRYLLSQAALIDFLEGRPGSRQRLEGEYREFSALKGLFDQIRVLDDRGQELLRVNYHDGNPRVVPESELQLKFDREYFRDTLETGPGRIYVSPLDLNVEHGAVELPLKPVIRFGAPIPGADGRPRGIVLLNYLGDRLLAALADASIGFPGRLLLINETGHYLRGTRREDEWGFVLGHANSFTRDHPEAWRRISTDDSGQFFAGRDLFTFRRLGFGPEDRMAIVAYVPRAVLAEAPDRRLWRMTAALAILLPPAGLLSWYVASAVSRRRIQEARIQESEGRLRELSAKLLVAQERERVALSRDLHDDLGQLVTSVVLDLESARAAAGEKRDRLTDRAIAGAQILLERIHEVATRVRPQILDDLGLVDAVRSYLTDFEERTGIPVRSELTLGRGTIPPGTSENVYRMLQEALTNVARHSRAAGVQVELTADEERICVNVRDDGVGFDPAAPRDGLGLLGMRERAELFGGSFAVRSAVGRGTEIRIVIPVRAP